MVSCILKIANLCLLLSNFFLGLNWLVKWIGEIVIILSKGFQSILKCKFCNACINLDFVQTNLFSYCFSILKEIK